MIVQLYFNNELLRLDITDCRSVRDIKAQISYHYSISVIDQKLFYKEKELNDEEEISRIGIVDNDMIELRLSSLDTKMNCFKMVINTPVQNLYNAYMNDEQLKKDLRATLPQIAEAIETGDNHIILKTLTQIVVYSSIRSMKESEKEELLTRGSVDEMDPEYQKLLYDKIHKNTIQRTTDVLVDVKPLHIYLATTINRVQVNFVVDTGAQTTIISEEVAQATSVSRVLNDDIKTEVRGVGEGMTVGFVHSCDVCIEGEYFPTHCQVMPMTTMKGVCLLGLDFLKKYHGIIDLVSDRLSLELNGKRIEASLVEGHDFKSLGPLESNQDSSEASKEMNNAIAELVDRLVDMGYPRDKAILAANNSKGDLNTALSMLDGF